jgi:hypothetical protein
MGPAHLYEISSGEVDSCNNAVKNTVNNKIITDLKNTHINIFNSTFLDSYVHMLLKQYLYYSYEIIDSKFIKNCSKDPTFLFPILLGTINKCITDLHEFRIKRFVDRYILINEIFNKADASKIESQVLDEIELLKVAYSFFENLPIERIKEVETRIRKRYPPPIPNTKAIVKLRSLYDIIYSDNAFNQKVVMISNKVFNAVNINRNLLKFSVITPIISLNHALKLSKKIMPPIE